MALSNHASIHSTILATSLAAVVAVGLASASIVIHAGDDVLNKADRLPVIADAGGFLTIETRADGISVLRRLPRD